MVYILELFLGPCGHSHCSDKGGEYLHPIAIAHLSEPLPLWVGGQLPHLSRQGCLEAKRGRGEKLSGTTTISVILMVTGLRVLINEPSPLLSAFSHRLHCGI